MKHHLLETSPAYVKTAADDVLAWNRAAVAVIAVAAFRLEATRAGFNGRVAEVVDGLRRDSDEFRTIWADEDVSSYGEGAKHILHPVAGPLVLQYSAFAVDGQPDLGMIVYTPATMSDADLIRSLIVKGIDGWTGLPAPSAG